MARGRRNEEEDDRAREDGIEVIWRREGESRWKGRGLVE